jgi:hypothetical protein
MALPAFKELHGTEPELSRVQANISLFTNTLVNKELLDGRLIEDVALSTTEVKVEHKLGRAVKGWIIVDKNAQQDIWKSATTLEKRFLSLTAAGTVTVSLWVF